MRNLVQLLVNRRHGGLWEGGLMYLWELVAREQIRDTLALSTSSVDALHLDDLVAVHWPEFGTAGKVRTTVRQLLAHQAGLPAFAPDTDGLAHAINDRLTRAAARA